jgi:hypothetical protein
VVFVGDYSAARGAYGNYSGLELPVYLAEMVESGAFVSKINATRLQYYASLRCALSRGETNLAQ